MRGQPSHPAQTPGFDVPPVDINAVGARERPFPWVLLACIGLVVVLALVALSLWLRTNPPFQTSRKEDLPEPAAASSAPRLVLAPGLADEAAPPPEAAPSSPGTVRVPAPVPLAAPHPSRPCADAGIVGRGSEAGTALSVDCRGRISGARTGGAPADAGTPAASAPADRYSGPVLLVRQEPEPRPDGPAASTSPQLASGSAPSSRPLPVVSPVTPLLDQLRGQLGTLQAGAGPAPTATGPGLPLPPATGAIGTPNAQGAVGPLLGGTRTDKALAARTLDENLTIPKGTQIDCALTTRVITEISGFASCVVSHDVFSANGRTLLVERMSEVQGEYATTSAQAGQQNIHILWTRLRKPGGITVDLASPATDGLGGAGLPGPVDNRWFERIGSAYLLSFIKDAIAYKTARDSATGSSAAAGAAFNNTIQQSNQLADRVLASTINIRPTQYANQGARVAIYVARDLDFSQVYALRSR